MKLGEVSHTSLRKTWAPDIAEGENCIVLAASMEVSRSNGAGEAHGEAFLDLRAADDKTAHVRFGTEKDLLDLLETVQRLHSEFKEAMHPTVAVPVMRGGRRPHDI